VLAGPDEPAEPEDRVNQRRAMTGQPGVRRSRRTGQNRRVGARAARRKGGKNKAFFYS